MDELQRQKVRKLRKQGYGYLKISQKLAVSPSTIRSFCKREGINGYIKVGEKLKGKDNLVICKQCNKNFFELPYVLRCSKEC